MIFSLISGFKGDIHLLSPICFHFIQRLHSFSQSPIPGGCFFNLLFGLCNSRQNNITSGFALFQDRFCKADSTNCLFSLDLNTCRLSRLFFAHCFRDQKRTTFSDEFLYRRIKGLRCLTIFCPAIYKIGCLIFLMSTLVKRQHGGHCNSMGTGINSV